MSWYKTGTISLTNGSATVIGTGTQWIANAAVGEALLAPDGKLYEIASVVSNLSITLASNYLGVTASDQAYTIVPTHGYIRDLATQAATLVNEYRENINGITILGTINQVLASTVGNTTTLALPQSIATTSSPTFGNLNITGTATGLTKSMVGLGSVDNTADTEKPVSTTQQTALNLKANIASPMFTGNVTGLGVATGTSFNAITGLSSTTPVVAGTAAVGTGTTTARADHVHPVQTTVSGNAGTATTLATARTINGVSFNGSANITINAVDSTARIALSEKGVVNGVATLDATGLVPVAQLPAASGGGVTSVSGTTPVVSSGGVTPTISMAAATTSVNGYMTSTYATKLEGIAAGAQINTVTSVAAKTGAVTLVKADVGLSVVDNTADASKPVSTAQQTALNLKADIASPTFTGTPAAPTAVAATNTTQLATTAHVFAERANTATLTNKTIGMAGALDCNNNVVQEIKTATFNSEVVIATTSGAITINWGDAQNYKQSEPVGSISYTFINPIGPCHLQLLINSDGTSTAQTITWPALTWMGGTWAGLANKKAIINFWFDGTNYFAMGVNQV